MKIPEAALRLAAAFEGFSSKPYLCPAGFWTIGYGHLCSRNAKPITKEQGRLLLIMDMRKSMLQTAKLCPILLTEPEHRFAAIIDFTFNLGSGRLQASTLRRKINERDWEEAEYQLLRWVRGGGRVLPGLVRRRKAEAALLRSGHLPADIPP